MGILLTLQYRYLEQMKRRLACLRGLRMTI